MKAAALAALAGTRARKVSTKARIAAAMSRVATRGTVIIDGRRWGRATGWAHIVVVFPPRKMSSLVPQCGQADVRNQSQVENVPSSRGEIANEGVPIMRGRRRTRSIGFVYLFSTTCGE